MEGDAVTIRRFLHTAQFQSTPSAWRETAAVLWLTAASGNFNPLPPHGGRRCRYDDFYHDCLFQSTPSAWRETGNLADALNWAGVFQSTPSAWRETGDKSEKSSGKLFQSTPSAWRETDATSSNIYMLASFQSTPSAWRETLFGIIMGRGEHISIHSLRMEGDSKTAQESVFHFAYPCTILQKRMQKTTFCTRKNGFFRKKGEKFGAKPSASFCAPMIRTDTFPLNFSHRISGSSMSMVSFAPICSTFD